MLEWNSQLSFSTDVPTSSRLQLLPFCSRLLLEPANDPPCASCPTFSREPGMTSLRIELVLKRRLSGNIAQRAIPTFLQATSCEHKFYIFAEIKCCCSDPYEVEGYSTFSGARRVPHRLSHNFRERSNVQSVFTTAQKVSGRTVRPRFSQPHLSPPYFESDSTKTSSSRPQNVCTDPYKCKP